MTDPSHPDNELPIYSDEKGDTFFGCLLWLLIIGGVAALIWNLMQ